MSKKACILLPGKIGDIIITLPIAYKIHQEGYEVHWPLWPDIYTHFNKGHFPYVKFHDICKDNTCNQRIKQACVQYGWELLDLSFTNTSSWDNENTKRYLEQDTMSFDQFRYYLANVDFEEKWNLKIERQYDREEKLWDKISPQEKYIFYEYSSSDYCAKNVDPRATRKIRSVYPYRELTDCVFDYLKIIENAEELILVESCFTNLIDQLHIKRPVMEIAYKRGYYGDALHDGRLKGMPVLKGDWVELL